MADPWKRAIPDKTSVITPGAKLGHEFNTLISFSENIVNFEAWEVENFPYEVFLKELRCVSKG
ncbi:uncharacterized protein G2W53_037160 [Senna tora]|uniref:Uncharacterized protein n=1 Tax=Senna tora TaxID=362788 RepID=A0A834SVD9_9FABA|nr:uncharacterized protein G2W53_037160 [Senna tora]